MFAVIKIEQIGNPRRGFPSSFIKKWTGFGLNRIEEVVVQGQRDYSNANSVGSRGVFKYYFLSEGGIYHVSSPESWNRTDEYYCQVVNNDIIRMDFEEALKCLEKQELAKRFMRHH
ncbi:MAG: hypothetical protein KKH70_20390 [Gammaproteobacteria bacterium]|uniref:Uncharacterized protein n=1 Tax=viral metagenome TaxID=1070528 RepID=A0A6M3LKM5_9ZZZZ|nr:hypothetical protein [Gammaproteobacteria bacterium]